MNSTRRHLAGLLVVVSVMLAVSGCQYHWGTVMHPQISTLAVGGFENETEEPNAMSMLRGGLAEVISTEPGVKLEQPNRADAIIEGRIISIRQNRLARAEIREKRVAEDDADEFQTVLYRVVAVVEFRVRLPATDEVVLRRRRVLGEADMSRWPDLDVVRQRAIDNALDDAARQIVSSVTEAW